MNQLTFASLAYRSKKKTTRREHFLNEMEQVVPWVELTRIVEPYYPEAGNGRPPIGIERMLRTYFMQQWFNLSDPGMEDALYDIESMRAFAGIELGKDPVPDESTILRFRHLLEQHEVTKQLFAEVTEQLQKKGLMVKEGTIVDATIIDAPTSTKNESKERDPEMHQVCKRNHWFFGMKAHVGSETSRGLVHTLVCTSANIHDGSVMNQLLHGEEKRVYGDRCYSNKERKVEYEQRGMEWCVSRHTGYKALPEKDRVWNRKMSRVRARVEHVFHVLKNLWGHSKVRYKGIAKNAAQLFTLFALANIYLVRRKLLKLAPRHAS